jgi:hypothetical protein
MARKPAKASKKARKKPAGSRKKRMSKPGKKTRKAAAKPARKTKAKTTAKAARKPAMARKPASMPGKMRRRDPDTAVNALIMMVLIMIALASGYLYLHNQPGGAAMAQPAAIAMEKK